MATYRWGVREQRLVLRPSFYQSLVPLDARFLLEEALELAILSIEGLGRLAGTVELRL